MIAGDEQSFEELVGERIFEPLGMAHSVHREHDVLLHRFAAGHLVRGGQIEVVRHWHLVRSAAAHGGLAADVPDQLRWLRFQLGDGRGTDSEGHETRVLRPETLRSMQTRQVDGGNNCEAVGYAWILEHPDRTKVWRHDSETNGHMAGFTFVPDHDVGITVLTNSSSGIRLYEELIDWVLDEHLGLRAPPPPSTPTPELAPITGRYSGALRDVVLSERDGELWVGLQIHPREGRPRPLVTPATRARFTSESTFVTEGPLIGEGNLLGAVGRKPGPRQRWEGRLLERAADR